MYIARPLLLKVTKAFQLVISVTHLYSAMTLGIIDFSAVSNFSTWKTPSAVTAGIRKMLIYVAQSLSIKVTKAFQLIISVTQLNSTNNSQRTSNNICFSVRQAAKQ
jgi:hypothetical protein